MSSVIHRHTCCSTLKISVFAGSLMAKFQYFASHFRFLTVFWQMILALNYFFPQANLTTSWTLNCHSKDFGSFPLLIQLKYSWKLLFNFNFDALNQLLLIVFSSLKHCSNFFKQLVIEFFYTSFATIHWWTIELIQQSLMDQSSSSWNSI